jgi:hypothetical protein
LGGKNVEFFNVKLSGKYSNHYALKGWTLLKACESFEGVAYTQHKKYVNNGQTDCREECKYKENGHVGSTKRCMKVMCEAYLMASIEGLSTREQEVSMCLDSSSGGVQRKSPIATSLKMYP